MIMTLGDSRVGKSTVTKLLIDIFIKEEVNFVVYDCDTRNKLEAYKNQVLIEQIDFFNKGHNEKIIDAITNDDVDVVLADMPGQYLDKICDYIVATNLFETLSSYDWRMTFLHPVSHRSDCVYFTKEILDFSQGNADYILVKNYYFDDRFNNYHNQGFKIDAEITLSKLHRDHYEIMDKANKPYSQIRNDPRIFLLYRTYIYQWIKKFEESLSTSKARKFLGL